MRINVTPLLSRQFYTILLFFKFLLTFGCKSEVLANGRLRAEAGNRQFNISPCGQGLWDLTLLLLYPI